jgi:3-oxoacyl-[acyl-carrier-protein] synthase-3
LLLAAAEKLDALRGREHLVRYVLAARTIPGSVPYPAVPLAQVCRSLGLAAVSFTVTQHACASGLLAVDMAGRLLAADSDPQALALVLTGEKAFTPLAATIAGITIMGEGAAAVLVRADGERDRMLSYATRTHGRFYDAMLMSGAAAAEFNRIYSPALAEVVAAALDQAGIGPADIDLVLPHNVNLTSWHRVAAALRLPPDRIFLDNVPVTGHCFCADPFINYQTACELGRLRLGDTYLMTSVGLGATFSAMVFRH